MWLPRILKIVFAILRFFRRSDEKWRRDARAGRPLRIETLDQRQMLSAGPTLYWDPGRTGPTTGPSGGSGSWDEVSGNAYWYNGTADVAWSAGRYGRLQRPGGHRHHLGHHRKSG